MNPMRDYLGVWPDVGTPPDTPFPAACPRTGAVLCLSHVRYLEWDGARWQVPDGYHGRDATPAAPAAAVTWATALPHSAPRSSKVLAAKVLNGEYPPELDAILAAEATGTWLGDREGQRLDGVATITAVTREADHPEYGPRYRVDLTVDGAECVWWTGESCWCDAGDVAPVRVTVKRRAVRHGRRVTTLTRVVRTDAEKRSRPGNPGVAPAAEQPR